LNETEILSGEINSTNVGRLLFQITLQQKPNTFSAGNNFPQNTFFNWTIFNIDSTFIEFQLKFENIYDVSKYSSDNLVFNMLQCDLFVGVESGKPVNCTKTNATQSNTNQTSAFETFVMKIPKQMDVTASDMKGATEDINIGLKSLMSTNLILSLFVAGSLQSMWSLVNALQVIVFTVLFNLNFPENVNSTFGELISLLAFDVFQAEYLFQYIFVFTSTPAFSLHFDEVGYGSSSFIQGLGSTFIIWIGIILIFGFGEILVRMVEHCVN